MTTQILELNQTKTRSPLFPEGDPDNLNRAQAFLEKGGILEVIFWSARFLESLRPDKPTPEEGYLKKEGSNLIFLSNAGRISFLRREDCYEPIDVLEV